MNLFLEIKRFLKNESKLILGVATISAILIAIVVGGVNYVQNRSENQEAAEDMETYQYEFHFFVEEQDGDAFGNPSIIFENIIFEDHIEELENQGYELTFVEEDENNENESEEIQYLIDLTRDTNSNRMIFRVTNEQRSQSEDIANHFHDLISNKEIEVLENKDVYMFGEPLLVEEEMQTEQNQYLSLISMVVRALVIGLIFGLLISVAIAFIKAIFSKTLDYSFTYDSDSNSNFIILNNNDQIDEKLSTLLHPADYILMQKYNELIPQKYKTKTINTIDNSTINSVPETDSKNEIIIIIESHKTSRNWYVYQKDKLRWLNSNYKIIQINDQ